MYSVYAWKRVDGIMQELGCLQGENDVLLELIHRALIQWKRAEKDYLRQGDIYMLKSRNTMSAQMLREIYISLLKEARKRELVLTEEQLLDRILYPDT
jgi:hypothetical protein